MSRLPRFFSHYAVYLIVSLFLIFVIYIATGPLSEQIAEDCYECTQGFIRLNVVLYGSLILVPILSAAIYQISNAARLKFRIRFRWRVLVAFTAALSIAIGFIAYTTYTQVTRIREVEKQYHFDGYQIAPTEGVYNPDTLVYSSLIPNIAMSFVVGVIYALANIFWLWLGEGVWSLIRWLRRRG